VRRQRLEDLHAGVRPGAESGPRGSSRGGSGCRYCGTIFPSSTVRCPSCGAPRTH
jgi:rubrerythrin